MLNVDLHQRKKNLPNHIMRTTRFGKKDEPGEIQKAVMLSEYTESDFQHSSVYLFSLKLDSFEWKKDTYVDKQFMKKLDEIHFCIKCFF